MKKKLLSVLMAGVLVASSSVNAFAANLTGDDVDASGSVKEYEAEVTITGDVADDTGATKPGTINVTVPTAATFAVNKEGAFTGTTLNVVNNGTQTIEVFVKEFIDVNGDSGIKLVSEDKTSKGASESDAVERNNVSLKLQGNRSTVYFANLSGYTTGVYSDSTLNSEEVNGYKISEIAAGSDDTFALNGAAGKKQTTLTSPIKDNFTLKLMVRKKKNNNI